MYQINVNIVCTTLFFYNLFEFSYSFCYSFSYYLFIPFSLVNLLLSLSLKPTICKTSAPY